MYHLSQHFVADTLRIVAHNVIGKLSVKRHNIPVKFRAWRRFQRLNPLQSTGGYEQAPSFRIHGQDLDELLDGGQKNLRWGIVQQEVYVLNAKAFVDEFLKWRRSPVVCSTLWQIWIY